MPTMPSKLVQALQKQQEQDLAWMRDLRQHHHEQQHDHIQALRLVNDSQRSTSQMRQLAQSEVDWTCFQAAVELYHVAGAQTCQSNTHASEKVHSAEDQSLCHSDDAKCSPRATSFSAATARVGCSPSSPRSPRIPARPYTAPTLVSKQPQHTGMDCPFYVTSLYRDMHEAEAEVKEHQAQPLAHADMTGEADWTAQGASSWSALQLCSPQSYLKAGSGGVAMTFGTRERNRPQTSSTADAVAATEPRSNVSAGISRGNGSKLINTMREGGPKLTEEKSFSHIVARSKAWSAPSADHPVASGLTVRQQAYCLGQTALAQQEQKLVKRYGTWQQDLRTFVSCSGPEAQRLRQQADAFMASADDAMTPRISTTGPI